MRVVALTLAALAFGCTLAGAASVPRLTSGFRGVVMRGPTTPVCRDTEPCEGPAAGVVLEFRRSGRLAASTRTGPTGRYVVRLRPGLYAVTSPGRAVGVGLTPRLVRAPQGRVVRVDFHLDTGLQ